MNLEIDWNALTAIGTIALAVITLFFVIVALYQNWSLKKQNEDLLKQNEKYRLDSLRNIKRPYLIISKIYSMDSNYSVFEEDTINEQKVDLGNQFNFDDNVFYQSLKHLPPMMIIIDFESVGEMEPINLIYEGDPHIVFEPCTHDNKYSKVIMLNDLIENEQTRIKISYKNIAGCKYWQYLDIAVKSYDGDITLKEAVSQKKLIIVCASMGDQHFEE